MSIEKVKDLNNISGRVRYACEMTGLRQKQVAEKIGIAPGYLSEIISAKKTPSDKLIRLIAQACGATEEWVREGNGEPPTGELVGEVKEAEAPYAGARKDRAALSPEKQILWKLVMEQMTDDEAFEIVAEYKRRIRDQEQK